MKIAYCAGHYLNTPGKRLPKSLDPNQTREWVLNDRVADYFASAALEYEGVQLLRTDDPSGVNFYDIPDRAAAANTWGADLYLDFHHNAGIKGGSGGGVEAFCHPNSKKGEMYRDAIYSAVIAAGGLRGNRSKPLQAKAFDSLRLTTMPAVLIECGYMDSATDAPVILTEAYSRLVGYATMAGIAEAAGLKKKPEPQPETKKGDYTMELRTLRKGHKGEDVRALQILLTGRGYNCGSADSIYGEKTEAAVRKYQKANKLTVDGIAGPATMAALLGV